MVTRGRYIISLSLLLVFSLNTVISTTCALGSFFHDFHHHASPGAQVAHHSHDHQGTHDHEKVPEPSQEECCSKSVVQFYQADKYVSESLSLPPVSVLFSSFISSTDILLSSGRIDHQPLTDDHSRRWRHPATIHDLRIAIQSFQI